MNNSPKSRFLAEKTLAKQFLDMVDSEAFCRAAELAMFAFLQELPAIEPPGADHFQQMVGADRFLEILRTLPEESKPLPARRTYSLNHDLK